MRCRSITFQWAILAQQKPRMNFQLPFSISQGKPGYFVIQNYLRCKFRSVSGINALSEKNVHRCASFCVKIFELPRLVCFTFCSFVDLFSVKICLKVMNHSKSVNQGNFHRQLLKHLLLKNLTDYKVKTQQRCPMSSLQLVIPLIGLSSKYTTQSSGLTILSIMEF